ncbi:hypothetical protein BJY00DRAFT_85138 [Aspergillus carlsbadensis]|nr:hypothetical protein BJY00DRAFT_85138 [Aspergillus carlsbadensis]
MFVYFSFLLISACLIFGLYSRRSPYYSAALNPGVYFTFLHLSGLVLYLYTTNKDFLSTQSVDAGLYILVGWNSNLCPGYARSWKKAPAASTVLKMIGRQEPPNDRLTG